MTETDLDLIRKRVEALKTFVAFDLPLLLDEVARLSGELAALKAENERLRKERERIQQAECVLTCVFCAHEYPPGTPTANHKRLREHVAVCPDHPAAVFRAERDALQAKIDAVLEACNETHRRKDEAGYTAVARIQAILSPPAIQTEKQQVSISCPGCRSLYAELQSANRTLKTIAGALLQCGALFETRKDGLCACTRPRGHKGNHGLAKVKS
jgi:hypothetical protein